MRSSQVPPGRVELFDEILVNVEPCFVDYKALCSMAYFYIMPLTMLLEWLSLKSLDKARGIVYYCAT